MKPNFALNITDTAISLLHRTSRGWLEVGSAAFDNPDLEEALSYLRSSALGLSPHGITTKLILPSSQVLYTEVDAPGPDKATRAAQIRAALEGRTPYGVDDLVFDWWGTGPKVQVAVVAKETLAEAEGFADTHRFNPVSFVTIPEGGTFAGEPWFGMTSVAATVLPQGQKVTRDQDPVLVIQRDTGKPKPEAEPEVSTEETERLAAEAAAKAELAERAAEAQRALEAREAEQAKRDSEAQTQRAQEAEREAAAQRAADDAARQKIEAAKAEMELRAQELAQAEAKRLVEEAEKTKAALKEREKSRAALIEAERARASGPDGADATEKAAFDGVSAPGIGETTETDPKPPAFASRRRDEGPASSAAPSLGPAAVRPETASNVEKLKTEAPKAGGPAAPTITSISATPIGPAAAAESGPAVKAPLTLGVPKPLNGTATFAQGAKPALSPAPSRAAPEKGPVARIPGKSAALSRFKSKVADPAQMPPPRGDGGLGKMGPKLAERRGKPRFLGLILTLVLLAIMAGVAAWSSLYLSRDSTVPETVLQADSSPVEQTAPEGSAPDAVITDTEALADAEAELPPASEIAAAEQPLEADAPEPAGPGPDVALDEATAQTSGPGRGTQNEIMLAGTDGQPPAFDAVALPRPQARPDGAPDAAMPPPPFGTQYEFDADGKILATQNGVIMPDGFWLIAARPPVMPPARPAAISDPAPATPEASPQAIATPPPENPAASAASASTAGLGLEGGNGPSSAFTPDATVDSRRPKQRPAALDAAPAEVTPTEDDASLEVDPSLKRLATLRPKLRPQSVVASAAAAKQADETKQAAEAASLVAAAAANAALQAAAQLETGSPMTVALSPRPAARPRDFSRAVAAAVSAATRESSRRQTAAASAAASAPSGKIDPEEEDEPEVKAAAAPRIPTRANVASQATFKNAINLSKTNLIGVYGTDNKRYALIRSASGRYTKVRVGDKVDGGIVAAITRDEVRYKKGNKMLSLAMPKG